MFWASTVTSTWSISPNLRKVVSKKALQAENVVSHVALVKLDRHMCADVDVLAKVATTVGGLSQKGF
jgi:hypothetical protein